MRIELLAPAAQWYMAGAVGSNPPPLATSGCWPLIEKMGPSQVA